MPALLPMPMLPTCPVRGWPADVGKAPIPSYKLGQRHSPDLLIARGSLRITTPTKGFVPKQEVPPRSETLTPRSGPLPALWQRGRFRSAVSSRRRFPEGQRSPYPNHLDDPECKNGSRAPLDRPRITSVPGEHKWRHLTQIAAAPPERRHLLPSPPRPGAQRPTDSPPLLPQLGRPSHPIWRYRQQRE